MVYQALSRGTGSPSDSRSLFGAPVQRRNFRSQTPRTSQLHFTDVSVILFTRSVLLTSHRGTKLLDAFYEPLLERVCTSFVQCLALLTELHRIRS
jgi:hypothetical protein